ncbi:hypothetical protein CGLO_14414 [Colletotrichum gloeosporioides Cg-14]|uniref:Uncharacterized protein n=1 Tax=Colletotrichum gloeosporioides (strain Cg-14) TaxID=1237896 RepID=T0JUC0_COLGC|nr:hypothetical protein CGLO_14414 [Colletotrichum gloeosporioides Cg-14]
MYIGRKPRLYPRFLSHIPSTKKTPFKHSLIEE